MLRPSPNWLLVFAPVSLASELAGGPALLTFATACLAILPLAALIGRATDALAVLSGPRVGGLLNATFGNITELIIGIFLVAAGEFQVVKASLVGSIIGNIVFVLGASLLAGGIRFPELRFPTRIAGLQTASLLLAVLGLLMPALFVDLEPSTAFQREVVSLVVAAVLIALYGAALAFTQLTHAHLFRSPEAEEKAAWSRGRATAILLAASLAVGLESELLVRTLQPTVTALGLSRTFVGLFVIAIVGNAAEHGSAVLFALRNRTDITMEIAFGSSTQIALFVAPLLVFISLAFGRPMDFVFSPLQVVAVGLSTLIVGVVVQDGRSNWLEGVQLLGAYVILAISFFFVGG